VLEALRQEPAAFAPTPGPSPLASGDDERSP
jgi:hypothetical protein